MITRTFNLLLNLFNNYSQSIIFNIKILSIKYFIKFIIKIESKYFNWFIFFSLFSHLLIKYYKIWYYIVYIHLFKVKWVNSVNYINDVDSLKFISSCWATHLNFQLILQYNEHWFFDNHQKAPCKSEYFC